MGNQRIVAVEPPGPDEKLFNKADPNCEMCGGLGRVRRRIDGRDLRTRACECTKATRRG